MEKSIINKLDKVLNKTIDNKKVFDSVIYIESMDGEFSWIKSAGKMKIDTQYAIASITKMYTATVIIKLIEDGLLYFDDTIDKFFPKDYLAGLHIYKGKEYTSTITIQQLLSNTTGLPDLWTEKNATGKSYFNEIYEEDIELTFDEALKRTKSMKSHFINGTRNKAFYSDINFDLLGEIAKAITHKELKDIYDLFIIQPQELKHTFLCEKTSVFAPIYLNAKPLNRPLIVASTGASGGIISTAQDTMKFLKSFYTGKLFKESHLSMLYKWNRIQWFPLEYGVGMMRCKMSRLMSPLFPAPEIIGHSGSTGTFSFYCPSKSLFVTGTINQINKQPFPLIYLLLHCFD
ncbi:serine hydrolase domain-containing protein [Clostridium sp. JNZ J1-5]